EGAPPTGDFYPHTHAHAGRTQRACRRRLAASAPLPPSAAPEASALGQFVLQKMKKSIEKATFVKHRKLSATAGGLQKEEAYLITRLTTLKSLCVDLNCAARFALHLTKFTAAEAARCARPQPVEVTAWRAHKALITRAVGQRGMSNDRHRQRKNCSLTCWPRRRR